MKGRLPLVLLAVSVAFNVFFAVGFVQAKSEVEKAQTLKGRAEIMAKRLKLDDQQRAVFEKLFAEYQQLRQARAPQRDAFLAEVLKDDPDEKVLEEYVAGEAARQYRLDRLALMRRFVGVLRPDQREKFVEMIKRRDSSSK